MTDRAEHISHEGATVLELVDFIVNNFDSYRGKERFVEKVVRKTLEYKTGDYGRNGKGIIYVVRWNINDDGLEADVVDLIIRKDYQKSIKLIKYIIGRNWIKFPYVQRIRFGRFVKYPRRAKRIYQLSSFFKKGDNHGRNKNCKSNTASGAVSR